MSDVTNIESEPVSNNDLVLMDFKPFETLTEIIYKHVLGEMIYVFDGLIFVWKYVVLLGAIIFRANKF